MVLRTTAIRREVRCPLIVADHALTLLAGDAIGDVALQVIDFRDDGQQFVDGCAVQLRVVGAQPVDEA